MRLFCFPLVLAHWVSDFHMSVPVSLHFNIVAVGQLLILVYHVQYSCFFSVYVSHLCTLPSPHLLKAGEVSLLQARLYQLACISASSSPLSSDMSAFPLNLTLPPQELCPSLSKDGLFRGGISQFDSSSRPPKCFCINKAGAHKAILYVLFDLMDYIRTFWQKVPLLAPFPNVCYYTWI